MEGKEDPLGGYYYNCNWSKGPLDEKWERYSESIFKWRCILCDKPALAQDHVQSDYTIHSYNIYRDFDMTLWVRCKGCSFTFHYECAKKTYKETPSIEELKTIPFKCGFNNCNKYSD